jgi:hypothetical protein
MKESLILTDGNNFKRSAYGTISYLPATFGSVCASVVIRELVGNSIPELDESARRLKKIAREQKTKQIKEQRKKQKRAASQTTNSPSDATE